MLWPVESYFVDALNKAYPDVSFVDRDGYEKYLLIKEFVTVDGYFIVPIRWSDVFMKQPYKNVMRNKYDMLNMDWTSWKDHAMWRRDTDKENALMEHLGITQNSIYTFVNKRYASNEKRRIETEEMGELPIIEMENIEGYSLFDWTSVILNATEIHTVSTSLLFMFEMLPITCPIHLYVRKPMEKDFSFVDYIFTRDYILHD